jgi:hypothetical protein
MGAHEDGADTERAHGGREGDGTQRRDGDLTQHLSRTTVNSHRSVRFFVSFRFRAMQNSDKSTAMAPDARVRFGDLTRVDVQAMMGGYRVCGMPCLLC